MKSPPRDPEGVEQAESRSRDFQVSRLLAALGGEGCPICRDASGSDPRYFFWFFHENYNSVETLDGLTRSLGFCPSHGAQALLNREGQSALAAVHDVLARRIGAILSRHAAAPLRREGRGPLPAPVDPCPACRNREEAVERSASFLAAAFQDSSGIDRYGHPGLLCFPHLHPGGRSFPGLRDRPQGPRGRVGSAAPKSPGSHATPGSGERAAPSSDPRGLPGTETSRGGGAPVSRRDYALPRLQPARGGKGPDSRATLRPSRGPASSVRVRARIRTLSRPLLPRHDAPAARAEIGKVADRFHLERQIRWASNSAYGRLPYCWERLENARAERLKRYGDISIGLGENLDPLLEEIIRILLETERILLPIRKF